MKLSHKQSAIPQEWRHRFLKIILLIYFATLITKLEIGSLHTKIMIRSNGCNLEKVPFPTTTLIMIGDKWVIKRREWMIKKME